MTDEFRDVDHDGTALRIEALIDGGQYAHAKSLIADYLAHTPDDATIHVLLAYALLGEGDAAGAARASASAIALDPTSAAAHQLSAEAFRLQKRFADARRMAHVALALAPNEPQPYELLVVIDIESKRVRRRTWKAGAEAVRVAPDRANAHAVLGNLYMYGKRPFKAQAAFRAALRLEPDNSLALHNLAVVQHSLSKVGTAAATWADLLATDPSSTEALHNIGGAARTWLRRLKVAMVVLLFVGGIATAPMHAVAPDDGTRPAALVYPGLLIATLAMVAASAGVWWHVRRSLGSRTGAFLRALPRADVTLIPQAIGLGLIVFAQFVVLFLPSPLALPTSGHLTDGLLILIAISWIASRLIRAFRKR